MMFDIDEEIIKSQVKNKDYRNMLVFMYVNWTSVTDTNKEIILWNIIEIANNSKNYVKDAQDKLQEMLTFYKTRPKGSQRQKADLAKILESKAKYFQDISSYVKPTSYVKLNIPNKAKQKKPPLINIVDENLRGTEDRADDTAELKIEEEEEPESDKHYYRNRYNEDLSTLTNIIVLEKNVADSLLLYYRIADDPDKYPLFNKKDTKQIRSLVETLTKNIDSNNRNSDKIAGLVEDLMKFENQRRQTNIETVSKLAEIDKQNLQNMSNEEKERLVNLYKKSSAVDAAQLRKFGLLNENFTEENLYSYYNRACSPKDDSDTRVRNLVLQLHAAIRETNIFDSTTEPKNKEQLQNLLKYISENGDREIFYNMNSDDNENEYFLEPKTMSREEVIVYSDDDEIDNDDELNDINSSIAAYRNPRKERKKLEDQEIRFADSAAKRFKPYGEFNRENTYMPDKDFTEDLLKKPKRTVGQRKNRDVKDIPDKLKSSFKIAKLSGDGDVSFYNQQLLDIIINGNFRIKYIPNAATRDLAQEYAYNHVDDSGQPRYRLLPPNTKDPNGVNITDLNGDLVDDIVLVDKRGVPRIINGYKIVRASPYKKVWKSQFRSREARKETPFNVWLAAQFEKSIDNVDWAKGEYKLKETEEMQKYTDHYTKLGLGKPRISKRLSPSSYWASIFSHIWKFFWDVAYPEYKSVIRLLNYLGLSNAMYIIVVDLGVKREVEAKEFNGKKLTYPAWVNYKRDHKAAYNERAGPKTVKIGSDYINPIIDIKTGEIQVENLEKSNKTHAAFIRILERLFLLVFAEILMLGEKPEREAIQELIQEQVLSAAPKEIKENKDFYTKRLTAIVDKLYGSGSGYANYKDQYKKQQIERKSEVHHYDIKTKDALSSDDNDNDDEDEA